MNRILVPMAAVGILLAAAIVAPADAPGDPLPFYDGFEGELEWLKFEEPVTPCHSGLVTSAGEIRRAAEAARTGDYGLLLEPNVHLNASSNHLSAIRRLDPPAADLAVPLRFTVHGRIPLESAATTQDGPEFSLQDTRSALAPTGGLPPPGPFLTATAGFQYVANPFVAPDWYLWLPHTGPDLDVRAPGKWTRVHTQPLVAGEWYELTLDLDFATGRYLRLAVEGAGVDVALELDLPIPLEAKGFVEEGFWISLDGENLWTCTSAEAAAPRSTKLHFDDVTLERRP